VFSYCHPLWCHSCKSTPYYRMCSLTIECVLLQLEVNTIGLYFQGEKEDSVPLFFRVFFFLFLLGNQHHSSTFMARREMRSLFLLSPPFHMCIQILLCIHISFHMCIQILLCIHIPFVHTPPFHMCIQILLCIHISFIYHKRPCEDVLPKTLHVYIYILYTLYTISLYTFHLSITKDRAKPSCLKLCMYIYIYTLYTIHYIYIYISFIYHKRPCEDVLPKTLHVYNFVISKLCIHKRICIHI